MYKKYKIIKTTKEYLDRFKNLHPYQIPKIGDFLENVHEDSWDDNCYIGFFAPVGTISIPKDFVQGVEFQGKPHPLTNIFK